MRSDDSFNDGLSNLVVDHLVVSTADEELVLNERREKKVFFQPCPLKDVN